MNFNLENIPNNELVYIDSNIFIYYVTGHPVFSGQCKAFLKRIEDKELFGATSLITFVEVRHKLIIINLADSENIKPWHAAKYIKKHPNSSKIFEITVEIIEKLQSIPNISKIPLTDDIFQSSQTFMESSILMSMDAVHAATMKINNIKNIATNDADFENVENIILWKPTSQ